MTDEATASGAEGVPIETGTNIPNPVESAPPERPSLDDTIDKAFAEVEKREQAKAEPAPKEPAKPAKAEAKPAKVEPAKAEPAKEPAPRGEGGKFASVKPKEEEESTAERIAPAPGRFHDTAKAEWEKTPVAVRGEVHRVMRELEDGHQKYKSDAEAYGQVKDYADMATKHGTNIRTALDRYVGLEMALTSRDPGKQEMGLAEVFRTAGIDPRAWAARVMGQTPDQVGAERHRQITTLQGQNAALERENETLRQQFQQHRYEATVQQLSSFAADHPDMEGLSDEIALEIKVLKQADPDLTQEQLLSLAYKRAMRLNSPDPAPLTPASPDPAHTRTPLDAGSKSITGAPASGSDPAIPAKRKGKPQSIDDALDRAFARLAS